MRTWWKILTDDIHYRVTAQVIREASIGSLEFALIDETGARLKQRVDQISTPRLTHAENPPSVTRRYVTNVMVNHGARTNEFHRSSNLLVYRTTVDITRRRPLFGRARGHPARGATASSGWPEPGRSISTRPSCSARVSIAVLSSGYASPGPMLHRELRTVLPAADGRAPSLLKKSEARCPPTARSNPAALARILAAARH